MTLDQIRAKVYFYTKTNSTSLPDATLIPLINTAFDRVVSLILQCDSRWEFDDTNYTDLPIGVTDLVASQTNYSLSLNFLEILRVELKDANSNWQKLEPFNQSDLPYDSLTDFLKTPGTPRGYDKLGSSVFLYPPTNYAMIGGLKVYYQRPPSYFETTDTSKQPGFNSLYHDLLPNWVSYDYSVANGLPNANQLMAEIQMKEAALQEDYANRSKDEPLKITPAWRPSSR